MNIQISVSKDFERCLEQLRIEYGEDFEYLNGLHESQLDPNRFEKNFRANGKNVANSTIDSNANVGAKDTRSLANEKTKSQDKLESLAAIFDEIKAVFGLDAAKECLLQKMHHEDKILLYIQL